MVDDIIWVEVIYYCGRDKYNYHTEKLYLPHKYYGVFNKNYIKLFPQEAEIMYRKMNRTFENFLQKKYHQKTTVKQINMRSWDIDIINGRIK